jgi:hypothetical protein
MNEILSQVKDVYETLRRMNVRTFVAQVVQLGGDLS